MERRPRRSLDRLSDVIEFYDRGGRPNPNLDREIRPLHLTRAEKSALMAFSRALGGTNAFRQSAIELATIEHVPGDGSR